MDRRSLLFVIGLTIAFYFVNQWFFPTQTPQAKAAPVEQKIEKTEVAYRGNEEYYVLENAYQQLVFSNVGGAVAEINLKLASKDKSSMILPTDLDRTFEKNYAVNDTFPSFPYKIVSDQGVEKKEQGTVGGYYPLLRRAIVTKNAVKAPTPYYALRIASTKEDLDQALFKVVRFEKNLIAFSYSDGKRTITKTYTLPQEPQDAPYCVHLGLDIQGPSDDLFISTGVPEVELISDNPAPSLTYAVTKQSRKTVSEEISLPKECTISTSTEPNWVCNSNGFFGLILDPIQRLPAGYKACKVLGAQDPSRLSLIDPEYTPYPADSYPGYTLMLPLTSGHLDFRYYAGPLQIDLLRQIDQTYKNLETGATPQYSLALSFHGWFTFISEPFAQFLFVIMNFFHTVTSSWGLSIILLTVVLRIMLYPLNAWSIKSTLRMQAISPKVAVIQERNKKDPKKAQMEIMMLYKQEGVNPLSGCFPMLIQLPFLIGMFDLLKSSFELRGAMFIPGWIDNLSSPDVLFSWNYPLPFFGNQFHLLPILLGVVMWLQQRFSSTAPKNKAQMTDQQKQQKMMGNIMTVVFTVMFYHFPSGLNLYWLSSMGLGILQQWWMMRKLKP
ncbi:MAG: inner membrane protein oxaA [Chlamydiota bacterium]|jgi:YidC/Oxa1 family membrane protein insertase